jgi:nucleoside-diphosphate-sugar epimerase
MGSISRGGMIVTGATGYLGSHFILRMLQLRDTRLTAIVRPTPKTEGITRVSEALQKARESLGDRRTEIDDLAVIEGDLRTERCGMPAETVYALRTAGVDEFWHFAADLRYEASHRGLIWRTNVEGARHALALAHAAGARRFVYISTAYTAGIAAGTIPETLHDGNGPFNNAYEESKCAAENLLSVECRALGLPLTIMRPSVVIGPRTTKRADGTTSGLYGLIRTVVGLQSIAARATAPIRVPATADAEMNFIPVDALMSDMISLREAAFGTHEVYHLTANAAVTVAQCLDAIASVTGLRNIVLRPPGSFEPNALERRIARRVEFYLGYLSVGKTFAHRLPSRWGIDSKELTQYVVAACRALEPFSPRDSPVSQVGDHHA